MQLPHVSPPRIALLNAAKAVRATSRNFCRELDTELDEFRCAHGELPPHFNYDGIVITGSWASIYWDRDWIHQLEAWVRRAVERELSILGICYGHQLLAHILGGRVEDMEEYEIGYRTVEHDGTGWLLSGIPESMTVFTTHSDRVAEPPPGAEVLAYNDYGIQGFRHDHVRGLQFHPEYDQRMAREITKGKTGSLSDKRIQQVLNGIHDEHYDAACKVKPLFDNFLDYVKGVRAPCVSTT